MHQQASQHKYPNIEDNGFFLLTTPLLRLARKFRPAVLQGVCLWGIIGKIAIESILVYIDTWIYNIM